MRVFENDKKVSKYEKIVQNHFFFKMMPNRRRRDQGGGRGAGGLGEEDKGPQEVADRILCSHLFQNI